MKAISYKQRNGRHRKALCPGAPQGRLCIMNGRQGLRHTWVFPAVLSCPQVAFLPGATLTGWGPWHQARDTPSESVSTGASACVFSSVQFSHSVMSDSLQPHEPQHARPPCPSPTPRVHPNPCPLSWWCPPTISSSVTQLVWGALNLESETWVQIPGLTYLLIPQKK